ncbi:MAG: hypothetical protein JSV77_09105 [Dehalococcoidales bacterium]|nr:MAG: hypothetical protein JSV77_09105 [Dehalococcoidales bacterium]
MTAKAKKDTFEPVPTSRQGDQILRRRKRSRKLLRNLTRNLVRLFRGIIGE